MKNNTLYEVYTQDKEFKRLMAQEDLIMEATEFLCKTMHEENINNSKLAELMNRTKGYISQILGGGKNLTLRTLADVAFHLGYTVKITLKKIDKPAREDRIVMDWDLSRKNIFNNDCIQGADDYIESNNKLALAP